MEAIESRNIAKRLPGELNVGDVGDECGGRIRRLKKEFGGQNREQRALGERNDPPAASNQPELLSNEFVAKFCSILEFDFKTQNSARKAINLDSLRPIEKICIYSIYKKLSQSNENIKKTKKLKNQKSAGKQNPQTTEHLKAHSGAPLTSSDITLSSLGALNCQISKKAEEYRKDCISKFLKLQLELFSQDHFVDQEEASPIQKKIAFCEFWCENDSSQISEKSRKNQKMDVLEHTEDVEGSNTSDSDDFGQETSLDYCNQLFGIFSKIDSSVPANPLNKATVKYWSLLMTRFPSLMLNFIDFVQNDLIGLHLSERTSKAKKCVETINEYLSKEHSRLGEAKQARNGSKSPENAEKVIFEIFEKYVVKNSKLKLPWTDSLIVYQKEHCLKFYDKLKKKLKI